MSDTVSNTLIEAYEKYLGLLDKVAEIKGQLEGLFGLIEVYCDNRFSSPSSELYLSGLVKNIQEKFTKYKDAQIKANTLTLEIRTFESQVKRGAMTKDKEFEISSTLRYAVDDITMTIKLYTEQLVFMVRSVQSSIAKEHAIINTGVDLVAMFNKRQKMQCDGKHYTVKFKMVQKDTLLGTNKTKEERSNGQCKHNKSGGLQTDG